MCCFLPKVGFPVVARRGELNETETPRVHRRGRELGESAVKSWASLSPVPRQFTLAQALQTRRFSSMSAFRIPLLRFFFREQRTLFCSFLALRLSPVLFLVCRFFSVPAELFS